MVQGWKPSPEKMRQADLRRDSGVNQSVLLAVYSDEFVVKDRRNDYVDSGAGRGWLIRDLVFFVLTISSKCPQSRQVTPLTGTPVVKIVIGLAPIGRAYSFPVDCNSVSTRFGLPHLMHCPNRVRYASKAFFASLIIRTCPYNSNVSFLSAVFTVYISIKFGK
jgi:hypothetical protein